MDIFGENNSKLGTLTVKDSNYYIYDIKKYNDNLITRSELENLEPSQGEDKLIRITFDKINQPIELTNFNTGWTEKYVAYTLSDEIKNLNTKIISNGKTLYSNNFIHDRLPNFWNGTNRNIFLNGINTSFDKNNKMVYNNGVFTLSDALKRNDVITMTLPNDSKIYFDTSLKVGDEFTASIEPTTFQNKDVVEKNKFGVFIPKEKMKNTLRFKVLERTPTIFKFQYIDEDMKVFQSNIFGTGARI